MSRSYGKSDTQNPLRICLLSYRSNPHSGGQGVYIKNLSRALKKLGHQVEVISGTPYALPDGIPVHCLPCLDLYNPHLYNSKTFMSLRTPSLQELRDPYNLIECLSGMFVGFSEPLAFGLRAHHYLKNHTGHYDVVHDNQSFAYGLLKIQKLIPTVATFHHPITVDRDMAIQSAPTLRKKLEYRHWYSFLRMQKKVARHIRYIITVSECAKRDIGRDFKVPPDNFKVVPNGIDTDLFYPVKGIEKENNRVIATSSADTPLKGLRYLLEAVAQVSQSREIKLTVVGNPKPDSPIMRLIGDLGIGEMVTFARGIDHAEFLNLYARSSIAVVPSLYEGFGLPAGEAMACGVPVISTTGGALPEVVGDAGVLVPPADAGAIAAALNDLLDHPEKAQKLGQSGLSRVHNLFNWEKAAEKTVATYREAIDAYNRV